MSKALRLMWRGMVFAERRDDALLSSLLLSDRRLLTIKTRMELIDLVLI